METKFNMDKHTLSMSVKITHDQVDTIVVKKLIGFRSTCKLTGKIPELRPEIDKILRAYFLTEEEFEKYVIGGEVID